MGTEMVFSGGNRVQVLGTNAETCIRTLNRGLGGEEIRVPGSSSPLAQGWVDVQSDEGVILVNPRTVAYVRDVPDQEPSMDLVG
jgi:hypothetical protein